MLKYLPFFTARELTLVSDEYIRIQERLKQFLYSSRDKEHDGVYILQIRVSMAKLWSL